MKLTQLVAMSFVFVLLATAIPLSAEATDACNPIGAHVPRYSETEELGDSLEQSGAVTGQQLKTNFECGESQETKIEIDKPVEWKIQRWQTCAKDILDAERRAQLHCTTRLLASLGFLRGRYKCPKGCKVWDPNSQSVINVACPDEYDPNAFLLEFKPFYSQSESAFHSRCWRAHVQNCGAGTFGYECSGTCGTDPTTITLRRGCKECVEE